MPEKSVRDIWLSTDEIKAIRDVKVSRENRIRKYLRNLYMFIHFIYLIFFYYFCNAQIAYYTRKKKYNDGLQFQRNRAEMATVLER